MKLKIPYINIGKKTKFAKGISTIINLANQWSQATRPKSVGQLSIIFPSWLCLYLNQNPKASPLEIGTAWKSYYCSNNITIKSGKNIVTKKGSDVIRESQDKCWQKIKNLGYDTIRQGTKEQLSQENSNAFVEELILYQTPEGFLVQYAIVNEIARKLNTKNFRFGNPKEEKNGQDAFINDIPLSIKPESYKIQHHPENIEANIIYYEKKKGFIEFNISNDVLDKIGGK